jgi:transposase
MAAKTIKVEQLKLIRQLLQKGYSIKGMVRSTGLSRNTIRKYLSRLEASDQSIAASLQEDPPPPRITRQALLLEHFKYAETELKKTGVTRQHLWQEYKELQLDGYNYSQYCYHFNEYLRHKEVVMHLEHPAGEAVMMDFAGKTLSYVNQFTGEVTACQVFVSVLPCSGLIYCRAVASQRTSDFADCINGMLVYYGGSPLTLLLDNLKTAVTRPDRYEPVFTELCYQMSEHYGTCFTAARPRKPRDKAMVERAVNIVYQNIYAPIRNQTFHSLAELNLAIRDALEKLNHKPYKGSTYSRYDLFHQTEKEKLLALPREIFHHRKVVYATVQRNYHIQLSENRHYYSVPHNYVGKKVKVLYDQHTIEVYFGADRIALHHRTSSGSAYHTIGEHMPVHHQKAKQYQGWTEEELLQRAAHVGKNTRQVAQQIISSSIYPQQNFKSCHGMLMLQNKYGITRLEAACGRALGGSHCNYTMIRNILEKGLDRQLDLLSIGSIPVHDNIRGPEQYQ